MMILPNQAFISQETENRVGDVLFALAEKGAITNDGEGWEMILQHGLNAMGRELGLIWKGDESEVPLDALFRDHTTG